MALKEAESRWPDVAYRADAPAEYARALDAVLDVLAEHSPTVEWSAEPDRAPVAVRHEPAARYTIFLDGTGLATLYGSEERLGRLIAEAVLEQTGHQARVGIADGRFAALRAAVGSGPCGPPYHGAPSSPRQWAVGSASNVQLVPVGGDAAFLAPLPITRLPLPTMARERVARLGVRTLGEFSRLPLNSVRHRLGPDGVVARGLTAGLDEGALRSRPTPLLLRDAIDLEWVETGLDRLLFLFKRLADRLSERLAYHGLGCGRLRVSWLLDKAGLTTGDDLAETPLPASNARVGEPGVQGNAVISTVRLAEPAGSGAGLLEHLRWHVEGLRPETFRDPVTGQSRGVRGIVVEAEELAPLGGHQLTMLTGDNSRTSPPERQLAAARALARLQARWGEDAVQQADLIASPWLERTVRWKTAGVVFGVSQADGQKPRRKSSSQRRVKPAIEVKAASLAVGATPLSMWLRAQPQEVEVERAARLPNGRKRHGAIILGRRKRQVKWAAGPWRLVGRQADEPVKRDAYHVVLTDGSTGWIVHDRPGDRWHLLGAFD
jgi:hypothetical protein